MARHDFDCTNHLCGGCDSRRIDGLTVDEERGTVRLTFIIEADVAPGDVDTAMNSIRGLANTAIDPTYIDVREGEEF